MIIDIFNHFMPAAYFERLRKLAPDLAAATAFPRLKTLWDIEARLRLLDPFGDYQQVLSLANPPLELLGTPERTAEIRLRILERAYDSPQIAATIARRLLKQGEL